MSDRKSLGADAGANGKAKPVKVEALKEKDAAKGKDQNGAAGAKTTPKKRRKVNHGTFAEGFRRIGTRANQYHDSLRILQTICKSNPPENT